MHAKYSNSGLSSQSYSVCHHSFHLFLPFFYCVLFCVLFFTHTFVLSLLRWLVSTFFTGLHGHCAFQSVFEPPLFYCSSFAFRRLQYLQRYHSCFVSFICLYASNTIYRGSTGCCHISRKHLDAPCSSLGSITELSPTKRAPAASPVATVSPFTTSEAAFFMLHCYIWRLFLLLHFWQLWWLTAIIDRFQLLLHPASSRFTFNQFVVLRWFCFLYGQRVFVLGLSLFQLLFLHPSSLSILLQLARLLPLQLIPRLLLTRWRSWCYLSPSTFFISCFCMHFLNLSSSPLSIVCFIPSSNRSWKPDLASQVRTTFERWLCWRAVQNWYCARLCSCEHRRIRHYRLLVCLYTSHWCCWAPVFFFMFQNSRSFNDRLEFQPLNLAMHLHERNLYMLHRGIVCHTPSKEWVHRQLYCSGRRAA